VQPIGEITFKFQYIYKGGVTIGPTKKGKATEQELILGKDILTYDHILDTTVRDNRLILAISTKAQVGKELSKALIDGSAVGIEVYGVKALELEKFIDRICSARETEKNRRRLVRKGKGKLFRTSSCPECSATIDLSELDKTRYVYCRFCETIFVEKQYIATRGSVYRVCDECSMFDRVRGYWEFYFYFFVLFMGSSSKRRYVCDNCAGVIFYKTFFLNLLFVLGVPASIYLKIKSLTGRDPYLRRLAKANALAKKGRYLEASPIYDELRSEYPEHPGLLMDEGLGHMLGGDTEGAVACFEQSLKACSNYIPVVRLAKEISEAFEKVSQALEKDGS